MKKRKKPKFKKRYWLLAYLVIVIFILVLLLHKPARYSPPDITPTDDKPGQVSTYLTHELAPQLYNGLQRNEPFDLIITQAGINDIITKTNWLKDSATTKISAPVVFFTPEAIVLMATAVVHGVELVLTVELNPVLDGAGLLNLQLAKVKLGAVNITPLAKTLARRTYLEQLGTEDIYPVRSKSPEATAAPKAQTSNGLRARIARSLLNDQPFEPILKIDKKKVRVEKITLEQQKLTIRLTPTP